MQLTFPARGKWFDEALSDRASTAANLKPIVIIMTGDISREACLRAEEIVHPRAKNEFIVQPTEHRWLCVIKLPWWSQFSVLVAEQRCWYLQLKIVDFLRFDIHFLCQHSEERRMVTVLNTGTGRLLALALRLVRRLVQV